MFNSVLIVDDHSEFRKLLKTFLEQKKFKVVGEAENGEEAIKLTQTLLPEFVIMDINMPVMNGINACKKIKKLFNKTFVILYSVADISVLKDNQDCKADIIVQKDDIFELINNKTIISP